MHVLLDLLMDAINRTRFSPYCEELGETAKERYRQRLAVLGICDPYVWSVGVDHNPDIYKYVISTPGVYTHQELKAYKSLEAYKYFANG